jgi:NodT family efflux transporter outer membrane factor (OMF) lipoprotein
MRPAASPTSSRTRRATWPSALVALLLASCKVGPNFAPPTPPPATRYTHDPLRAEDPENAGTLQHLALGQEVQADWWTLFRSATIDQVVKQALEHNRTLVASQATLAQAQELAAAQAGTKYPQITATAGIGRQKYGEEFLGGLRSPLSFSYYAVGPAVSYTLDTAGGIQRGIEGKNAEAGVAQHQLDAAYLAVTGQAVLQTLAIASTGAQIATLQKLIDQDRDNLKLVETAFNGGSVARIDVLAAKSQIVDDLTLLPPLRQDLARAHHALSVVLGRAPADDLPADVTLDGITLPQELPVTLPSELAHRRPDILAAEAQLHVATAAVGVADANLYPQIQLSATGVLEALKPENLFDRSSVAWSLLSGLTQPVFDGGQLRAQKRAAVDAMRASAAAYEETVLEAFGQVADLLEALDHDAEELDAQTQAEQGAMNRLDLVRASYAEGNSGVIQVLDAERSYQRARLGYVRALAQRYIDTVQLFLALGGASPASDSERGSVKSKGLDLATGRVQYQEVDF